MRLLPQKRELGTPNSTLYRLNSPPDRASIWGSRCTSAVCKILHAASACYGCIFRLNIERCHGRYIVCKSFCAWSFHEVSPSTDKIVFERVFFFSFSVLRSCGVYIEEECIIGVSRVVGLHWNFSRALPLI